MANATRSNAEKLKELFCFQPHFRIYESKILSKYVLEVVSGFADKNNLKEGDKIDFLY